jgi:hypothetical protein
LVKINWLLDVTNKIVIMLMSYSLKQKKIWIGLKNRENSELVVPEYFIGSSVIMDEHSNSLTDVFEIWSVRLSVVFYLCNLTDQKTHFLAICVTTDNLTDAYFTWQVTWPTPKWKDHLLKSWFFDPTQKMGRSSIEILSFW